MTWLPAYFPKAQELANNYDVHISGKVRSRKTGKLRKVVKRKGDGYCSLILYGDGKQKFVYLHQLVAYTFLGDPPEGRDKIDHIDRRPWNNDASNLQWASHHEQAANKHLPGDAPADPLQAAQFHALKWVQRAAQFSGETLREEILNVKF